MSAVWADRKVIVCAGTGGVGKTTVSAAIAVAAAASGQRTLVMTIDPARRLANALGIADFGNVEREIEPAALAPFGLQLKAPLWAMMPDVKRTFDDLINRVAPDEARRQQILDNRIYQQFSTVLAGSLEYASVEKLYEVYSSQRYDLIVLDTPPSQNAFDFLHAPGRIIDFLEQDTVQWLLKPYALAGRFSLKLVDLGTSFVMKTLGRFTGGETLRELAQFVMSFSEMYEGFRERALAVRRLLTSEDLAFVLVTTTRPLEREGMLRFRSDLAVEGIPTRAVVVNRVHAPAYGADEEQAVKARLREAIGDPVAQEALLAALAEEEQLALQDQDALRDLEQRLADTELIRLGELPLDAHDLESLVALQAAFRSQ